MFKSILNGQSLTGWLNHAQLNLHYRIVVWEKIEENTIQHVHAVLHPWRKIDNNKYILNETFMGWYNTSDLCSFDSKILELQNWSFSLPENLLVATLTLY